MRLIGKVRTILLLLEKNLGNILGWVLLIFDYLIKLEYVARFIRKYITLIQRQNIMRPISYVLWFGTFLWENILIVILIYIDFETLVLFVMDCETSHCSILSSLILCKIFPKSASLLFERIFLRSTSLALSALYSVHRWVIRDDVSRIWLLWIFLLNFFELTVGFNIILVIFVERKVVIYVL